MFSRIRASALLVAVAVSSAQAAQDPAEVRAQATLEHAIFLFQSGRPADAAAEFDGLVRIAPDRLAYLWQRGIALYYAGRYDECRKQFEAHRTVNPNDVENAAWHFLCVARSESPERARAALLPVGPDPRVPMEEIYRMFRGARPPEQVIGAAVGRPQSRFYALLYAGLYLEATGSHSRALEHIRAAAQPQYAASGGYMHMVARVHVDLAQRAAK